MRLLGDNADSIESISLAVDLLEEKIIDGEFFDDEYIDTKADMDLTAHFDLQQRLGIASANKKQKTVIGKDQLIKVKRVKKYDVKTGQYDAINPEKDHQVKVMSKERVKVSGDGPERKTRVMVTVKELDVTVHNEIEKVLEQEVITAEKKQC